MPFESALRSLDLGVLYVASEWMLRVAALVYVPQRRPPSAARARGTKFHGAWRLTRMKSAWEHRAIVSSARGATVVLHFTGGALAIIGERWRQGGRIRVTIDGRSRTISLHAKRRRDRQVLYRLNLRPGRHRITIRVLRGTVALEGLAISNRR